MILSAVPPDQAELIMQDLQRLDEDISAQRTVASQAQETLAATQLLSPPTGYPPPRPLPATLPYPTSRPTSSRARPLEDSDGDPGMDGRRLHPRIEGGSPSPRASSPPVLTR